jgi:membrane associated rhomboid family serine protease
MLILLVAVLGLGYRCTTPQDRGRIIETIKTTLTHTKKIAAQKRQESEPFRNALRARTPRVIVVPALIALNVTIFVFMLRGDGALSDPETLLSWGANFGPRTTNLEWWRLVTSMFVHTGLFQLAINLAALAQVGLILERIVGRTVVISVYLAAGVFASLLGLWSYPVAVQYGASGAVFGLYGLLGATVLPDLLRRRTQVDGEAPYEPAVAGATSPYSATNSYGSAGAFSVANLISSVSPLALPNMPAVTIPRMVLKRLAPMALLFFLYNLTSDTLPLMSELAGVFVGLAGGLVLTKMVNESESPMRRVAWTLAATFIIAVASAVPIRGIADIRPEMTNLVAIEDHTTHAYQAAADDARKGRVTAEALARLIDEKIVPELQTADSRLNALEHVPSEHQPLVAEAKEYVRLRSQSWRLKAEGLRKAGTPTVRKSSRTELESDASWRLRAESQYRTNMTTFAKAESAERASLAALERIKAADLK